MATIDNGQKALDTLDFLCTISGVLAGNEHATICSGTVSREGPILLEMLKQMTVAGKGEALYCQNVLGLCPAPSITVSLDIPPSPTPTVWRPFSKNTSKQFQIVHYSDLHVDPNYVEGSRASCDNPVICCRNTTGADMPGNNTSPAGPFGDHRCDAPARLQESMFKAIREIAPDATFSIFTGDIIEHDVWATTKEENQLQIQQNYELQASYFPQVYGTVGNHEGHAVNSFPINPPPEHLSADWVYKSFGSGMARWINKDTLALASTQGRYSTLVPEYPTLRIISIDTNLYYKYNLWAYVEPIQEDPKGQLAWLIKELKHAERKGQFVYIIGHMPMGDTDAILHNSRAFDEIVNRFSRTIRAMFFGHTHLDHFQITYKNYTRRGYRDANVVSFISPALTPLEGNPAFKIYNVDDLTFGVCDITSYYTDLSDATFQQEPVWRKLYSARKTFSNRNLNWRLRLYPELHGGIWHNLTERWYNESNGEFDKYWKYKTRLYNVPECDEECRKREICNLRAASAEANCSPKTIADKIDVHAQNGAHCGKSIIASVLQTLHQKDVLKKLLEWVKEHHAGENTGFGSHVGNQTVFGNQTNLGNQTHLSSNYTKPGNYTYVRKYGNAQQTK